mgnify:CR=1 FL=1
MRETERPIELGRFNVLLGRNNSGKTTVLEALSLLPHPDLGLPWVYEGKKRHEIITEVLHDGRLATSIYKYSGEAEALYHIEFGGVSLQAKVKIRPEGCAFYLKEGRVSPNYTLLKMKEWGFMDQEGDLRALSNLVLFIPSSGDFIRRLIDGAYRNFELIESVGAHNRVVREVINKCIDEEFTEVVPVKQELRLRKEYPDRSSFHVRLKDVGDGLERAVSVLLWLDVLRPKLVLWDDIEANMHPSLIGEVLRWLAERDWQVVLATHSLDVLFRLRDVWPEDARIILLCKTPDDALRADYMSLEELDRAIRSNQDPRYLVEWLKL